MTRALRWGLAAAASLVLSACAASHRDTRCPPGALCLLYGNGAEPFSLDPQRIDGSWENTIVSGMIVGLTARDQLGRPVPAMATSWDISPDGLTWTFHLRDAQWSDGTSVTADDFVFGIRRQLDPKTASFSAFLLYPVLKNAQAVNKGALPLTAVGVEAPDPHTVVMHLEHPWPTLPYFTSGRIFWPAPKHAVERWGDKWTAPGHYVANGPYNLVSWKLGDRVEVRKNPMFWDAGHVCYNEIDYFPTSDAINNERLVRADELDLTTTVQSNRIHYLKQNMGSYLRVAPQLGITYLEFNLHEPGLSDVRVRQALAMAVDREFIVRKLLRGGQTPAYSFVPPGVIDYPNGPKVYWASWSFAQRQAEARRLLAAAGYGPVHPLKLLIKHRNSSDPLTFMPAIQSDWRQVGVDVQLQQNDVQVAYNEYEIHDFQVGDAGWVGGEDPNDYLSLDRSDTGGQNYGGYVNHAFDAELDRALDSADPKARAQHFGAAEQMILADMPNAPLYFVSSRNLVNPGIIGWTDNPVDAHGVRWLCRAPLPGASIAATAS
jgi:oligopeptide transport system substrate-binding protein